jgi:hypothetical protein
MKIHTIFSVLLTSLVVLLLSAGCTSQAPARYPAVDLPITKGMSTSTVLDDIIEIPASKLWHKTIEIPATLENTNLSGWCVASGGARNDIKVLVLNDVDFYNWKNFGKVQGIYQSEKTTIAEISAEIAAPGKYHLVISNWFSEFSTKKVIGKVYLYWSIKPVTYKIKGDDQGLNSNEFRIPKNANTTFEFIDPVDTSNFHVFRDGHETPVATAIKDQTVTFIAPSVGIYEFECGSGGLTVKGSFSVIPAQPVIGHGLEIFSSVANAPPSLDRIGDKTYNPAQAFDSFTVSASDPDDDKLYYYAFNLPEVISGDTENIDRVWKSVAELDKDTGLFTWNDLSRNLQPGEYYIRIEVSDGILSDYEDLTIIIN